MFLVNHDIQMIQELLLLFMHLTVRRQEEIQSQTAVKCSREI